jgi:SPP1 gp7 family putative phage head morphogenesis protein
MQIQPKELETTAQVYERIIATSYIKTGKDILESIPDANVAFSIYDKSIIQAIIKRPLAGATFNDTIFRNIKVLSKTVETTIGGALAMGQSYQKTTKQVEELLGIGKRQAMRVVRTQSNYYNNQAELQVYEDLGVKKYQYSAFLDMRTSSICKRLHNKIFEVKDAKVGENYPPMHPNCRSTTNEVLSKADERHIAKLIRPQTLIELENKWGVNTNMRTDTGATKLGYGSIVTKLNQGYNKQLNAEAEYISQVYSKLKPKRKYEAYERIKEIKDLSKDTAQIELVLKYLEKPKLDRRIKKD